MIPRQAGGQRRIRCDSTAEIRISIDMRVTIRSIIQTPAGWTGFRTLYRVVCAPTQDGAGSLRHLDMDPILPQITILLPVTRRIKAERHGNARGLTARARPERAHSVPVVMGRVAF